MTAVYKYDTTNTSRKNLTSNFLAENTHSARWYNYFGSRYYDSELSIWLSVDPMAAASPHQSPYVFCSNSPLTRTDPTGMLDGDYYTFSGQWLGSDGIKDDKAYTADSKNADGTFANAQELPITNKELLNRATWVHGESGGSSEVITNRTQNVGDASATSDARVADYYAGAIQNAVAKDGSFDNTLGIRMSKEINGKTENTSNGYFSGTGIGGNKNSKAFANARNQGIENLMNLPGAQTSISAVINSVSGGTDPSGGARAWLGDEKNAGKYVNNPNSHRAGATFQFSFSSGGGKFYHTFYRNK